MVYCGQWQLQHVPVAALALGRVCTMASAHPTAPCGPQTLLDTGCPAGYSPHHGEELPCSLWLVTCPFAIRTKCSGVFPRSQLGHEDHLVRVESEWWKLRIVYTLELIMQPDLRQSAPTS